MRARFQIRCIVLRSDCPSFPAFKMLLSTMLAITRLVCLIQMSVGVHCIYVRKGLGAGSGKYGTVEGRQCFEHT